MFIFILIFRQKEKHKADQNDLNIHLFEDLSEEIIQIYFHQIVNSTVGGIDGKNDIVPHLNSVMRILKHSLRDVSGKIVFSFRNISDPKRRFIGKFV